MKEFELTLWRTFSRGRREKHSWRSFIDTFVKNPEVVRDKRKVAGFSLGGFEDNKRTLKRVEAVYALVLDFDGGDTTVDQAHHLFPRTTSVVYTTYSHTVDWPKLRVIYPFSRPVTAAEYDHIWNVAAQQVVQAGHSLDEAARDASRFWYLPSHAPGAPYEWREREGKPLDVEKALESQAPTPRPLPGVPSAKSRPRLDQSDGLASESFFGRAFVFADMAFEPLANGSLPVICPWSKTHTCGVDGDTSTVVFAPTTESMWGLFHCSHAHCAQRRTLDLLDVLPEKALAKARVEHGRGLLRVQVINGWEQRLAPLPGVPGIDRFVLKCRPREGGVFTMTVKQASSMHVRYLDSLPLAELIGRRLDVSLEGKIVKAALLVV